MKLLLIALINTFSIPAFALKQECTVTLPTHIYQINDSPDSDLVASSNCDEKTKALVSQTISRFSGKISAGYLSLIIKEEFDKTVSFSNSVTLFSLKDIIMKKYELKDMNISLKAANDPRAKTITHTSDDIELECQNCTTSGRKNVLMRIGDKKHWLIADLRLREQAYILKESLTPHLSEISPASLIKKTVYRENSTPLFTDISNIRHYRLIRPLKKGSILTQQDLRPKLLVHAFKNVEVELNGEKIRLKTTAKAIESGRLGDIIKLTNLKTNKTIKAKVVDNNKVKLHL